MRNLSLRWRSFLAALVAMVVFIPLAAWILQQAFSSSLTQSFRQQIELQSLNLISEFEIAEGTVYMPERMVNDKFNMPGSGLYAIIQQEGETVWQSLSAIGLATVPKFTPPSIGDGIFSSREVNNIDYFEYGFTAEFESNGDYVPVSFYILQDKHGFNLEKESFNSTLFKWFVVVALFLLALLLFSLRAALQPIQRLIEQIELAESGQQHRIDKTFPPELEQLKSSINHLLDTEQQQRKRYKNSLSDLAHSLKTPLAVLRGNPALPDNASEPVSQIDAIIQRQLKRAVAGVASGWEKQTDINPILLKLMRAMEKVYADKSLQLSHQCEPDTLISVDSTDLLEILGNLIDNACKAAKSEVLVICEVQPTRVSIHIEDDGPGISKHDRDSILNRGARLDSYKEGQGIGMSVVVDLIGAYQGKMQISDATLGGAKFTLHFPL